MKIQLLLLPDEVVGELVQTPFVLVFSEVDEGSVDQLPEQVEGIKSATGARGVLVFEDPVEIVVP